MTMYFSLVFFFFNDPATTEIYPLPLHDALPIWIWAGTACWEANKPLPPGLRTESVRYAVPAPDVSFIADITAADAYGRRSEEHTSELQSQSNLVCRLLLEKKKTTAPIITLNTVY